MAKFKRKDINKHNSKKNRNINFVNNVEDTNYKSRFVLHSNGMSPECVENVCGPSEV